MHPNPIFRADADSPTGRALLETLIEEVTFGMVFAATPDGPRVVHTPLLGTGKGTVRFHVSRGNALARHLEGATALALINGPEGYVSPRWYSDPTRVPTWNYIALELEGLVRRMDAEETLALLESLSNQQESRITEGEFWTMAKVPPVKLKGLLAGIIGFELAIEAWRPTFKLSQNVPAEDRERLAAGLEAEGSPAIAQLMRTLAP